MEKDSLEKLLFKQSEILMARRYQSISNRERTMFATSLTLADYIKLLLIITIAGLSIALSAINEQSLRRFMASKVIYKTDWSAWCGPTQCSATRFGKPGPLF